jgi:hypothetical protein
MKKIILILAIFLSFIASAAASTVSKEDACRMPDGLHEGAITIQNYPGFAINMMNYYKE